MYPNLKAEIARCGLSLTDVAGIIKRTNSTTSMKLNGKADFTLQECKALSVYFEMPIDRLFEANDGSTLRRRRQAV